MTHYSLKISYTISAGTTCLLLPVRYSAELDLDFIDLFCNLIFSAEASHMLIRNVNYEIPSLKRQIAKDQQTQRVSHFLKKNFMLILSKYGLPP